MAPLDQVRDCLCLHSRRSARALTQFYDTAMRSSGLRVTQFTLLAGVGEMGSATSQGLADFMGMDRTTLTRNLALLVAEGLVSIDAGEKDRRQNRIALTQEGQRAVARAMPLWKAAQAVMVRRLSAQGGEGAAIEALQTVDRLSELAKESERFASGLR